MGSREGRLVGGALGFAEGLLVSRDVGQGGRGGRGGGRAGGHRVRGYGRPEVGLCSRFEVPLSMRGDGQERVYQIVVDQVHLLPSVVYVGYKVRLTPGRRPGAEASESPKALVEHVLRQGRPNPEPDLTDPLNVLLAKHAGRHWTGGRGQLRGRDRD